MSVYKITLKPLMPYFFGGESTFGFGRSDSERSPYYIKSEEMPSQTTLFGMLRYEILKKKGLLFGHEKTPDRNLQINAVGENTFSFDANAQSFGIIKKITPVFLSDGKNNAIPCPLAYVKVEKKIKKDNKTIKKIEKHFVKLQISDDAVLLNSAGIKGRPTVIKDGKEKSLTDKEYPVGGFFYIDKDGKLETVSPIKKEVRVGINSHRCESERTSDNDSFFKKEYCELRDGYAFVFYAFLDEDDDAIPKNDTVFMGQGKSPFAFTAETVDSSEYENMMNSFMCFDRDAKYDCYMALSDCHFNTGIDKSNVIWQMIATHPSHNLIGKPEEKSYYSSYKRSDTQLVFVNKGSVFYVEKNSKIKLSEDDEKKSIIGMNCFIKIGG